VGNSSFELSNRSRPLRVELWYPADEAARAAAMTGQSWIVFVADHAQASSLSGMVAGAPAQCLRLPTMTSAAPAPAHVADPWPPVLFSLCHGCVRFSSFSLAEQLASHGFLVAAVDHAGSTLFDQMAGQLPPLDQATLELRRDDLVRVIDELLDP